MDFNLCMILMYEHWAWTNNILLVNSTSASVSVYATCDFCQCFSRMPSPLSPRLNIPLSWFEVSTDTRNNCYGDRERRRQGAIIIHIQIYIKFIQHLNCSVVRCVILGINFMNLFAKLLLLLFESITLGLRFTAELRSENLEIAIVERIDWSENGTKKIKTHTQ